MVEKFLEVLRCTGRSWISDGSLEGLSKSSHVGKARVGGIDINQPRIRAVMAAVLALAPAPQVLDKVIKPLLAGVGRPRPESKAHHESALDRHYEAIQQQMLGLFDSLGIAA
jgi:hypothetical protein